jgi:CobQ-like glutamine amidotransferase family enzyme
VTTRQLTVAHLYPDVMSTHGDRGNVAAIVRRCHWRDVGVTVTELGPGDKVIPGEVDLIVIGGGGESRQRQIAADLCKIKGAAIRDAVAAGTAALAVGGGYELFGRFCQPERGAELRGIELFNSWTISRCGDPGDPDSTYRDGTYRDGTNRSAAAAGTGGDAATGDLVVRWDGGLLVGFENSRGRTYLGAGTIPLGRVVSGRGNNGDGSEGVRLGSAVGTNMRGPCLPVNPALADFLISAALRRRYGSAELAPLPDDLELAARGAAMNRTALTASGRGLTWALRGQAGRPAGGEAATPRPRFGMCRRAGVP